jgi:hypothetical protein
MSVPPRKPIVFVFETIAASAPARNEPSCSRNVADVMFGLVEVASMIAKWRRGYVSAT